MTDRELEDRLRAWYGAEVDDRETAPSDLRDSLAEIPVTTPPRVRALPRRSGVSLLAAAALLVVVGALAAGPGGVRFTALVPPTPSDAVLVTPEPSPTASSTLSPSASPTHSPTATPAPTPTYDLAAGFSWAGTPTTLANTAGEEPVTKLADGRVLITEGCGTDAELYDPTVGTFTPTGSLTAQRAGKTATLLQDGRVLITGGYDCGPAGEDGIWATAEIFDPATGTFDLTGSMHTGREFHTATLLADGRVLIAGGYTAPPPAAAGGVTLASVRTAESSASVLATAELFDPATGRFSTTGPMSRFRDNHTATLLQDGRVLVVGGGGEGYASSQSADVYDPATGDFTATGSLATGRWLHTATRLADGQVLVLGGRSPQDSVDDSA